MAKYEIIDESGPRDVALTKPLTEAAARRELERIGPRDYLIIACAECGWDIDDCTDDTDDHEEHHRVLRAWRGKRKITKRQ